MAIDLAIELLWPTADADAPKAALEVALARLRKLLDVPGVVLLTDGKLHLDERIVWSDVAAFETHERVWIDCCHAPSAETRDKAIESAKAAIALYRGELLSGEDLSPAWQMLRDRLARRFSRLVTGCGGLLESQGRWPEACDVYEHGIACSALAEPIYRALMRVQLQLGERAEALRTYSLCRDALKASLGVAPTHETMLLHDLASHTGEA